MKIFCNESVSQETLTKDDWVVSSVKEEIAVGNEAGCNTIYLGDEADAVRPSLFAPTVEDALRFIKAYQHIR